MSTTIFHMVDLQRPYFHNFGKKAEKSSIGWVGPLEDWHNNWLDERGSSVATVMATNGLKKALNRPASAGLWNEPARPPGFRRCSSTQYTLYMKLFWFRRELGFWQQHRHGVEPYAVPVSLAVRSTQAQRTIWHLGDSSNNVRV